MEHLMAVILAAGEGKRMKSKNSKVVHRICGKALIEWVHDAAEKAGVQESIIVVGHRADQVKACMGDRVEYVLQEPQLGTGHAVMQAEGRLKNKDGYVLVLCGDAPLVTPQTLMETVSFHKENNCSATVITAEPDNPTGYGRIVRDCAGNFLRIVEHRDASPGERRIREINSGMYCFSIKALVESLRELDNKNDQGEYYLTDTIEIMIGKGLKVGAYKMEDSGEVLGVNDRVQLFEASQIIRKKILDGHMRAGVTIIDPLSTYIDEGVTIGADTLVYPGTIIERGSEIGEDCEIGPNTRIIAGIIGNSVKISNSVVLESSIGDEAQIGPFAYIRPGSAIGKKVKIGDFVEVKKSVIGNRTKIPHLAYIGDAEIGSNTNIGCGVITVNYDGKIKHKTIVGNNSFVGCNVNLVAPVRVDDNSYIAAGSTITDDVPGYCLAIARSRQVIKDGWVKNKGMERKE